MSASDGETPIVEPKPHGDDSADLTLRALQQRIRQQEILAELGVGALQGASFDTLVADTARLTAEGLRTEFCKVLEHIPSENRLLVRAGVGWVPALSASPALAPTWLPPQDLRCALASRLFPTTSKARSVSALPKFSVGTASTAQ